MSGKNSLIVLEQSMIKSNVWLSLSGTSVNVYLLFRTKCRIEKRGIKRGKRDLERMISNNGEIVFTYAEAKTKYRISKNRFRRAVDELLEKGFIDIAETGMGVHKVTTLYAISERWRKFGTPDYKTVPRPKPPIANPGFKKGNKMWKRRANFSSAENDHGAVFKNKHGQILVMHTNEHGKKQKVLYKWRNNKWLDIKAG